MPQIHLEMIHLEMTYVCEISEENSLNVDTKFPIIANDGAKTSLQSRWRSYPAKTIERGGC